MTFNATTTVRELAVEMPYATRVLEKLKIDYCCGGNRTFVEACGGAGVEVEDVLRQIEESSHSVGETSAETINFQTMPLNRLTKHIVEKHHAFTRHELDRLGELIGKVSTAHAQNHPELLTIQAQLRELRADLLPHMDDEEQMLFPYSIRLEVLINDHRPIRQPEFGSVRNPVRLLMVDHELVGALLQKIRETSNEFTVPADGCISYRTLYHALEGLELDLHQHIHLENNILFPRVVELEGLAK
jgi:regulator of cell morphogenesis and NO signaling